MKTAIDSVLYSFLRGSALASLVLLGLVAFSTTVPPEAVQAFTLDYNRAWSSVEMDNTSSVAWSDWDGNGYLNLAVGNHGQPNRIYRYDGLNMSLAWSSAEQDDTNDLAWGDWLGTGQYALAVGNWGQPSQVYANNNGSFEVVWSTPVTQNTRSIAWGDWNGNGLLDLAVGNFGQPNRVYENLGYNSFSLAWTSPESSNTTSMAWGDWDGDGQLELVVGNWEQPNQVYKNEGTTLSLVWESAESDATNSVAWGDWNNNGYLDLAVGNVGQNRVYENSGGDLTLAWTDTVWDYTNSVAWDNIYWPSLAVSNWNETLVYQNSGGSLDLAWTSEAADNAGGSVSWGDWTRDGTMDLAVGSAGERNRIYADSRERGGNLFLDWTSPESYDTRSIAWGDWTGNGYPDLAVGNWGEPNHVYINNGSSFFLFWSSLESDYTTSVAWGDWNGDGQLDLVVGNYGQPNRIYASNGYDLSLAWSSPNSDNTTSVAWGDWNGNGLLDLAVGNEWQPNQVYTNDGGSLNLAWSSAEIYDTTSLAWGDWSGNGLLDLAVGNGSSFDQVYVSEGSSLSLAFYFGALDYVTRDVAWGDWNGDGLLDLAVGTEYGPTQIYVNNGSILYLAWFSLEFDHTTGISWGDWNGDGLLDLAVGNSYGPDRVYTREGGGFSMGWSSPEIDDTTSIAWWDWDGDGVLDLVVGSRALNRVYTHKKGNLEPVWSSPEIDNTTSVAWGDWNGDGLLDLAVGNRVGPNRIYTNDGGNLNLTWTSPHADQTHSLAWGDWNGNGFLDLAVGNSGRNRVYENSGGILTPFWISPESDDTRGIAWGDWNGNGLLDLAVGNWNGPARVYTSDEIGLTLAWSSPESDSTTSIAWGDWSGNGFLDLVVGNWNGPNRVYINNGGELVLAWSSLETDNTTSVAWGDWNGNGLLDLAVGNLDQPNRIYVNNGEGGLSLEWSSSQDESTRSIAWADWSGNGFLDLAVGNSSGPNRIYGNLGGSLDLVWTSLESDNTRSIAWGDWNGDGLLDLAVGNWSGVDRVYASRGDSLSLAWSSLEEEYTTGVAWGDWDGDGLLDLAVGNWGSPNHVYANDGDNFSLAWSSPESDSTTSIAWGDWNGNGLLDLAVGNSGPNRVYVNEGNSLSLAWSSPESDLTSSIAWGDWSGNGLLDLAVGNHWGPNQVYINEGGNLSLAWSSSESDDTTSVAWGDWNGNGLLDLAVGNWRQPNRIYANLGDDFSLVWSSLEIDDTTSVAWGDWNGDGRLDLAVGNDWGPNRVYVNEGGSLRLAWSSPESDDTTSVAWGDWNGNGLLDLAVGNSGPNRLYANSGVDLSLAWSSYAIDSTTNVAWGDWNRNGSLDLAVGNGISSNYLLLRNQVYTNRSRNPNLPDSPSWARIHYPAGSEGGHLSSAIILQGPTVPITYTLYDNESHTGRRVEGFYSLDHGSSWQPAVATSETITTNLAATPNGFTHVYHWDIDASNVFGATDTAVFRLDVYQGFSGPGPYQYVYRTARTSPFRLRGSQVRVMDEATAAPIAGAVVFRRPVDGGDMMAPYTDLTGNLSQTNPGGYLSGFGELKVGDELVAMVPISVTENYTLYHTSAAPTTTGLDTYQVTAPGVQTMTVSAVNQLLLFDLDVSLEWDARNDETFTNQLYNDIRRTSRILYDLTNGQAALGNVRIHHDKGNWNQAHIAIMASNTQHPSAILGGIVMTPTHDIGVTGVITNAYVPGQIRMPPTWNRFGNPDGVLGEDWPRVLAHELGHYLFYMADNYLGLTEGDQLILVDCQGSAMTNPYVESYSEFLTRAEWEQDSACMSTLAERYLGRADWETITAFYDTLDGTTINSGPSTQPLAVTNITFAAPDTPPTVLADPFFNLTANGSPAPLPMGRSEGYLLKQYNSSDPTDYRLVFLGSAVGDLIQARGAAPGDRLCVFDYSQTPLRLGCVEVGNTPSPIALHQLSDWSPEVQVTPVTSTTFAITVTNVVDSQLNVQLLPAVGPASTIEPMVGANGQFTQTIMLADPAFAGHVRVWVADSQPLQETIVEFVDFESWNGRSYAWGGRSYAWGGRSYAWGAPMLSGDGQVSVFTLDNLFGESGQFTLQAVAAPPDLPGWLTPVGRAYRVESNEPFVNNAILFRYLGRDVPGGHEAGLRVYYLPEGESEWQRLATELNTYQNHASAKMPGPGVYVLIATIEVAPGLQPGWNTFGYPVQETRPIPEALASIDGYYTAVTNYDPYLSPPWRTYYVTVTAPFDNLVNTLSDLEYTRAYWLYATEAITLYLGVDGPVIASNPESGLQLPPATFYGWITSTMDFQPAVGMPVTAWIGENLCGQSVVQADGEGRLQYTIRIVSENVYGNPNGCGNLGDNITFKVDDWVMDHDHEWGNSVAWYHSLMIPVAHEAVDHHLFLPVILNDQSATIIDQPERWAIVRQSLVMIGLLAILGAISSGFGIVRRS